MNLRPYQSRAVDHILTRIREIKSLLVVSPVATGKTTIFAECAMWWAQQGARVLVLVHREELLKQAHERLAQNGVQAGIIWRDQNEDPTKLVQVASLPTLAARGVRPLADYVIVDEAHHTPAPTWRKVVQSYQKVVGFTATPVYLGGQAVEGYDEMFEVVTTAQAVAEEWLSPLDFRIYEPEKLEEVSKVKGDFAQGELGKVMSRRKVIDDIAARWKQHAKGRSTLVFAATVKQSQKLAKAFNKAGVKAEHLDATIAAERTDTVARFSAGEFPVLCNVGLFTEGTDIPRVKCIVLARPTYSVALYLQMTGRGMRPWNNETCLILDHGQLCGTHGFPDDVRDWNVGGKTVSERPEYAVCRKCGGLKPRGENWCPNGCEFEESERAAGIDWVPRGYEYDRDQFVAARSAKYVEAIRLCIEEGKSIPEAALSSHCSARTLRSYLKLNPSYKPRSIRNSETIKRLHSGGFGVEAIASETGLSVRQVLRVTGPLSRLAAKARKSNIANEIQSGKSVSETAHLFGVSERHVFRIKKLMTPTAVNCETLQEVAQ